MLTGLVDRVAVVDTGRTDDLRDDNALCAVDDEGTVVGHHREVAHVYLGLFYLTGLLVGKSDPHLEGRCVVDIALLAFLDRVLRLRVDGIIDKLDNEVARVIDDRRNIVEHFPQTISEEPLKRLLLHLEQIGHFNRLADS